MKSKETFSRSLIKTVTYRIVIIISTYIISLWLTADHAVSFAITSISSIANTILYLGHERIWNVIKWGKK